MRCALALVVCALLSAEGARAQDASPATRGANSALGFVFGSTLAEARAACVASGHDAHRARWNHLDCSGAALPFPLPYRAPIALHFDDDGRLEVVEVFLVEQGDTAEIETSFRSVLRYYTDLHGSPRQEHGGDVLGGAAAVERGDWQRVFAGAARVVVRWPSEACEIALTAAYVEEHGRSRTSRASLILSFRRPAPAAHDVPSAR